MDQLIFTNNNKKIFKSSTVIRSRLNYLNVPFMTSWVYKIVKFFAPHTKNGFMKRNN